MPRTNEDIVCQLLAPGRDYDGHSSLFPFLIAANVLTNRLVTEAATQSKTLSLEELTAIEGFLAAHFYKMSDRQTSAKLIGRTNNTYGTKMDMGLEGTTYGQCAISLDHTGILKLLGNGELAKNSAGVYHYIPPYNDVSYPGD